MTTDSIETSEREASAPVSRPVADAEIPNRGPRITPADVDANIASEHYFTAAHGALGQLVDAAQREGGGFIKDSNIVWPEKGPLALLTFCVLVLANGFTVTGESACAAPENFDAEIGKRIARANAVRKVWPLMGYQLRTALSIRRDDIGNPI